MSGTVRNVTQTQPAAAPVVQTEMDRRAEQVVNLNTALVASNDSHSNQCFNRLDLDLRLRCCELLSLLSSEKTTVNPTDRLEVLRNPASLLRNVQAEGRELSIIDHVLYEVRGGVSEDEMVSLVAAPNTPFPRGVAALVAKYAMQRFEDIIFGPQQWVDRCSVTPVNRSLEWEFAQPPEAFYTYLNSRRQPGERLIGHTSVVTYIPERVRREKDDVFEITSRTLDNLNEVSPAELGEPNLFTAQGDLDATQPSCYFVMEQCVRHEDLGQDPSDLQKRITATGEEMPALRNALAAVFCHTRWTAKRQLADLTYIYCRSTAPGKPFVALGNQGDQISVSVRDPSRIDIDMCTLTAVASRTFPATVLAPPK